MNRPANTKSEVRIIAGRWRGRKVAVAAASGLRPTPDRVRETLFNWLAAHCRGARVLDCFAGSGVLGFEAMSRGAASLLAIESDRAALACLRRSATTLGDDGIRIVGGDALRELRRHGPAFDLVFVDPPYALPQLRAAVVESLLQYERLAPAALLYFEWPATQAFEPAAGALRWVKQGRAGQVNYALAELPR